MTKVVSRPTLWRWLASLLGVTAGLWGVTVILLFGKSQVQMIGPGTPLSVVLGSDGPGLSFLLLQLIGYAACTLIAVLAAINKLRNSNGLWLMLLLSLGFMGLSLIPFSSIGLINLPAAVGLLASSILLRATAGPNDAASPGRTS